MSEPRYSVPVVVDVTLDQDLRVIEVEIADGAIPDPNHVWDIREEEWIPITEQFETVAWAFVDDMCTTVDI